MRVVGWLGLCAILWVVCPTEGAQKEFDPKKMEGKWSFVSGVKDGEKLDDKKLGEYSVTVTKESYTLKAGDATFVMKYTLDTKKTPVAINLEITEGPVGVGMKSPGIVELKDDEMKLCYNAAGGDAPKTFESKSGTMNHYFVLKRAK